jgi:ribosomal protein L7/L12
MPHPLPDDVRAALAGGRKIDAIRLLRERTGLGLAQAKAAVEAGFLPDAARTPARPPGPAGSLPSEVHAALAAGNLVQAIKLLRQTKGVGLKQAKALADEARRAVVTQAPQTGEGPSPGEVPRSKISPGLVALVIVLAGAAWLWLGL